MHCSGTGQRRSRIKSPVVDCQASGDIRDRWPEAASCHPCGSASGPTSRGGYFVPVEPVLRRAQSCAASEVQRGHEDSK